jgi:inosose dehydratase
LKFGFHTIWGWKQPLPEVLDEISKAGFKGFEAFSDDISTYVDDAKTFLDIISEKEIQLVSIHTYGYYWWWLAYGYHWWWRSWRLHWWRHRRWWSKILKFAVLVGCEKIVLGGHQHFGKKEITENEYMTIASLLNKIGKTCKDFGVEATYHPHRDDIIHRRDFHKRICELTDPDLVHLTIETGHMAAGGFDLIEEAIPIYRERINLVHFKDFKNERSWLPRFGEGEINFLTVMKLLRSIGYRGWIIIDDEAVAGTIFESAKKARKHIDALLRQLG